MAGERKHTAGPDAGPEFPNWSETHKLPWRADLDGNHFGQGIWIGNENVNVCLVFGNRRHPGNRANAEFIVRACNNFYPLLEALEGAQKALAMMIAPEAIKQTTTTNAFAAATEAEAKSRAAINRARATGGEG